MTQDDRIKRFISNDRFEPYLYYQKDDLRLALSHYQWNIEVSESFYPLLSILEIGFRNSIDNQLSRRFNDKSWYANEKFLEIVSQFQINRINEAKANLLSAKKEITPGRMISELSFGFWTSLFDTKFEMTLWKSLRHSFPHCPKNRRKRKAMSAKFNGIRKLRNRIFHHESITWNLTAIRAYKLEILEGINWIDNEILTIFNSINRVDEVISKDAYLLK